ncbi:MAG: 4-hydroxybenzoate octaprenyltransferase [Gammaproteobacteria bacterium]|nr:4-hydroxybenzoate octaprenyltransferase [Gammaproteobacteria bacterium]
MYSGLFSRLKTRFPETADKLPAYAQLIRLDKPIGILLLLWPTIGALWIAAEGFPGVYLFFIFVLGTAVMRSAGCCINDFADSDIDGNVARTENRPLARGALTRKDALNCFCLLSLVGFLLVLMTNLSTVLLSVGALAVTAIYPFMKRYTNLPQVVLGIAFSWGILMAFTAQTETVQPAALLLFIANTLWTIAYDTQYAMVDREFDKKIGVKSTAILFGEADKTVIGVLQSMFIAAMYLAGQRLALGNIYNMALMAAGVLLVYQQILIRDRVPDKCFRAFLNNNWVGAVIFAGILVSYL